MGIFAGYLVIYRYIYIYEIPTRYPLATDVQTGRVTPSNAHRLP